MFAFQKLNIYKLSKELIILTYKMTKGFPSIENYGLTSQMNRSAISIASNIAEGSGRFSIKDKTHYLTMAFSSLMELSCQCEIAYDLEYITKYNYEGFMIKAKDLSVRINNYKEYLKKQ